MIQIVFENENFVFCDKPSGVLSTPGRPHEKDARLCLGTALQDQLQIQIYPVHRLDFEVSGLVLYAKNPKAHSIANGWFEKKQVRKTYRALSKTQDYKHIPPHVENPRKILEPQIGQAFEWRSQLLRGKKRSFQSPQGKPSVTSAIFLGRHAERPYLAWDLSPITGRPHQLRFEMSHHGFPIVGDSLYGSQEPWVFQAIALRSYRLDFSECDSAEALKTPEVIEIDSL